MTQGDLAQFDQSQMKSEQKSQLEDYVLAGYEILYDEGAGVIKVANRTDTTTKVEDVSNALFMTAVKIDQSREQSQLPPFPDQVKMLGGYHLNEKIIEFSEHRGAKPFTDQEKQASLQKAYQKYMTRGIKDGTIDAKELAVAAERAQPGSITDTMAGMPDDTPGPLRDNNTVPAAPPAGAPAIPAGAPAGPAASPAPAEVGLLGGRPSPLERFLR